MEAKKLEAIDILKECTVSGNVVTLPPGQFDRKLYQEVAKKLELIGGKWKGGKVMGFVFQDDPTELLAQIASGEDRNLKKEFQFFATPDVLADKLVQMAIPVAGQTVCEPSAGQGAIVKALLRYGVPLVYGYELMPVNQIVLSKIEGFELIADDFLTGYARKFDVIVANPPFSKNQDIDHIRRMYDCLNDGGNLVSMASKHWQFAKGKKETEFREWLEELEADIDEVPAGTFKESGTNIETVIISIRK